MDVFDFDTYLNEKLKDPEFKARYNVSKERIDYINKNVQGANRCFLIGQLSLYNIDVKYLNSLPIKKLYKIAKQHKLNIN